MVSFNCITKHIIVLGYGIPPEFTTFNDMVDADFSILLDAFCHVRANGKMGMEPDIPNNTGCHGVIQFN